MALIGNLIIRLRAMTGAFDRNIGKSGRKMNAFGKTAQTVQRSIRALGVGLGAAGVVYGTKKAVTAFAKFDKGMASVSTMLDRASKKHLPMFRREIERLAIEFGQSTDTLTKGLYDILSAGTSAAQAMSLLRVATRAAIGGATDTATAVDGLTTVLNAYGYSANQATHVSDVMFTIVKEGKITYAELAENIGKIAPTAKVAGMRLEELGAFIATLVKVEKPERAMTALRAAMMHAAKSGEDLMSLIRRFRGKTLEDIVRAGISKRAAAGVALLASNFGILTGEIEKFKDVTGAAGQAFTDMADNAMLKLEQLSQRGKKVWRDFGEWAWGGIGKVAQALEELQAFPRGEGDLDRMLFGLPPKARYKPGVETLGDVWERERKAKAERDRKAHRGGGPFGMIPPNIMKYVEFEMKAAEAAQKQIAKTAEARVKARIDDFKSANQFIEALRLEAQTFDMTARQADIFRLSLKGLTAEQTLAAGAAMLELDMLENTRRVMENRKQLIKESASANEALRAQAEAGVRDMERLAEGVTDALKTPIEKFKEYRQGLQDLVTMDRLAPATMTAALQKQYKELAGEAKAPTTPGQFRVLKAYELDIRGLGSMGVGDPKKRAEEERDKERNRLLKKIADTPPVLVP